MPVLDHSQSARASVKVGRLFELEAEANLTTGGLLAITVLVSGILLSTTVLVATAVREGRRARHQRALDEG